MPNETRALYGARFPQPIELQFYNDEGEDFSARWLSCQNKT
jgi:hypothetical protein